jgi:hypothetical protein
MALGPKRLTPQTQQEAVSRAQFTEAIAQEGWLPAVPTPDLGEDFCVHIYIDGEATGANVYVQLKSTTKLAAHKKGDFVPVRLRVKDLLHWASFALPVVVVLWDISLHEGRWVMVKDVISQLHQSKPGWLSDLKSVTVSIPWHNTTQPLGLQALQHRVASELLPLILRDSPIEMNLRLGFPETEDGQKARLEFERSFKEGTPTSIAGSYIQDINFSGQLQKWLRHIPPNAFQIEVGPAVTPQTRLAVVEAIGSRGTASSIDNVQLSTISAGTEVVRLNNAGQNGPILVELVLAKRTDTITFGISLSLKGMGRHAMETRKLIQFFEALAEGADVSLSFPGSQHPPLTTSVPPQPQSRPDPAFSDLVGQICRIQEATGRFISIPAEGISPLEAHKITETTTIIRTGVLRHEHASFRPTLARPALRLVRDLVSNNIPPHMRLVRAENPVTILGHDLSLGPLTRSIRGTPDITLDSLATSIAQLDDGGAVTISFPDVTVVDIYPKWMLREANRIAEHLLFLGANGVFLYGSLVWEEVLPPDASIQLAVDGLSQGAVSAATDSIRATSRFQFELAPVPTLPILLQQRIDKEGRRLPSET